MISFKGWIEAIEFPIQFKFTLCSSCCNSSWVILTHYIQSSSHFTIFLFLSLSLSFCAVLAVWWVGGGGGGWQAASTWRPSALQLLSHPQWVLERPGGEGLCQVSCHYQHMFLGCNVWDHPLSFSVCFPLKQFDWGARLLEINALPFVQVSWLLWELEGWQHLRGHGGFHGRHRILVSCLISHPPSPLEVSDCCSVQRQPPQLLHPGTRNTHLKMFTQDKLV